MSYDNGLVRVDRFRIGFSSTSIVVVVGQLLYSVECLISYFNVVRIFLYLLWLLT